MPPFLQRKTTSIGLAPNMFCLPCSGFLIPQPQVARSMLYLLDKHQACSAFPGVIVYLDILRDMFGYMQYNVFPMAQITQIVSPD